MPVNQLVSNDIKGLTRTLTRLIKPVHDRRQVFHRVCEILLIHKLLMIMQNITSWSAFSSLERVHHSWTITRHICDIHHLRNIGVFRSHTWVSSRSFTWICLLFLPRWGALLTFNSFFAPLGPLARIQSLTIFVTSWTFHAIYKVKMSKKYIMIFKLNLANYFALNNLDII